MHTGAGGQGHKDEDEDAATPGHVAAHVERLARLPQLHRRLRASESVAELFAATADAARELCGFGRAIVLTVGSGALTADGSDALADPESDRLRRRVQAAPVMLAPGSLEAGIVRHASPPVRPGRRPSLLADALGLEDVTIAAIAPDLQPLALLVADRPGQPLGVLDQAVVANLALIAGVAFEHVVLHARVAEVSAELMQLTASTQSMMSEVLQAPMTVPAAHRGGASFPQPQPALGGTTGLLTEREEQIAMLLVEGRSNRDIAERLMLSPETVKDYVARLRRKLHAANRVEAASRYLRMTQAR